jgi:malate synthase
VPDAEVAGSDLLAVAATPGEVTEAGLRQNVSVGVRYIAAWLAGTGAAAIDDLMEDAATAEISRSQVWQWVRHGRVEREHAREVLHAELERLGPDYAEAGEVFEEVALGDELPEFLTLGAYERLK